MSRTTILVIRGAFAAPDQYRGLADLLPEYDWIFWNLPTRGSLEDLVAGFQRDLSELSGPVVVCGISFGGIVALGLAAPNVSAVIALDPPMRPHLAWPLRESFRQKLGQDAEVDAFVEANFGLTPADQKARDHHRVLEWSRVPAFILCGSFPLQPEREFVQMPSLVDDASFAALQAHPRVWARRVGQVGHNISTGATSVIIDLIRQVADNLTKPLRT